MAPALDIDAYERLIDELLETGRIDRAKFDSVADDTEAVAALVRDAIGREMLATLKLAQPWLNKMLADKAHLNATAPSYCVRAARRVTAAIAQAAAAGISTGAA